MSSFGLFVQRERQILRGVENLHLIGQQLHRAGTQLVVHRQALADGAGDAQAVFVADLASHREGRRVLALDHHLGKALVVTQVDEGHVGLQANGVDPAAQGDGLADQCLVDEAAVMRAHALGTPGRGAA